jgi:hypothetical protein
MLLVEPESFDLMAATVSGVPCRPLPRVRATLLGAATDVEDGEDR